MPCLSPVLRERQDEAEERCYFLTEILDWFRDASFYRMHKPQIFGGYDFDSETFLEEVYRIAAGHPSSGWCFMSLGDPHRHRGVALLPGGATGAHRSRRGVPAPHRAVAGGTIVRVNGGYRVESSWRFSSGIPASTHFIGNALFMDGDAHRRTSCPSSLTRRSRSSRIGATAPVSACRRAARPPCGSTTCSSPGTTLHGTSSYLGVMGGPYQLRFAVVFADACHAIMVEAA